MEWPEFAARVRRRAAGTNEDHDWDDLLDEHLGEGDSPADRFSE
jgi:hypothetical protein